jgi:hypothetical protein
MLIEIARHYESCCPDKPTSRLHFHKPMVKQGGVREKFREETSTFRDVSNMSTHYETCGDGMPILMIHGFYPDHRPMKGCMELVPVDEGERGSTLTCLEFQETHFSGSI